MDGRPAAAATKVKFAFLLHFLLFIAAVVIGVGGQFAPWGNGFFALGMFFGSILLVWLTYRFFHRWLRLGGWKSGLLAVVFTAAVAFVTGYISARPEPASTLAYMIGGPVPPGVKINLVRRQWFDGETYIARFSADPASVEKILSYRTYEVKASEYLEQEHQMYRHAFATAAILKRYMDVPVLGAPKWYEWGGDADPSRPGRSEYATLVLDEKIGECWLMFYWT